MRSLHICTTTAIIGSAGVICGALVSRETRYIHLNHSNVQKQDVIPFSKWLDNTEQFDNATIKVQSNSIRMIDTVPRNVTSLGLSGYLLTVSSRILLFLIIDVMMQ